MLGTQFSGNSVDGLTVGLHDLRDIFHDTMIQFQVQIPLMRT